MDTELGFLSRNMTTLNECFVATERLGPRVVHLNESLDSLAWNLGLFLGGVQRHASTLQVDVPRAATSPPPSPPTTPSSRHARQRVRAAAYARNSGSDGRRGRRGSTAASGASRATGWSRPPTRAELERMAARRLVATQVPERFRRDSKMETVVWTLLRQGAGGMYLHDIVKESGLTKLQCNMYLNALLKADVATRQSKRGLLYTLNSYELPRPRGRRQA